MCGGDATFDLKVISTCFLPFALTKDGLNGHPQEAFDVPSVVDNGEAVNQRDGGMHQVGQVHEGSSD